MKEYWQITQERGVQTIGVWGQFNGGFTVKKVTLASHTADVEGLPGLAAARDALQTALDQKAGTRDNARTFIADIATRAPHVLENNLDADDALMGDLGVIYAVQAGVSEASDLNRARKVVALWKALDAERAAMVPALGAITVKKQGENTEVAAAVFETAVGDYGALQQKVADEDSRLSKAKTALRVQEQRTDRNNKRWYGAWSSTYPVGSAENDALAGITTESGTAKPAALEIASLTVSAGSVEVSYVPDGGAHATALELQYRIHNTETEFGHSAPVVAAGQTAGPFATGAIVDFRTRVTNSAGTTLGTLKTVTVV